MSSIIQYVIACDSWMGLLALLIFCVAGTIVALFFFNTVYKIIFAICTHYHDIRAGYQNKDSSLSMSLSGNNNPEPREDYSGLKE